MYCKYAVLRSCSSVLLAAAIAASAPSVSRGADEAVVLSFAEGKLTMRAPAGWIKQQPRVRIIEAELAVPGAGGDKQLDGRCTVMSAGGSVQANIDRWIGQFNQPTRNLTEKRQIAGREVQIVDLAGAYKDQAGPFAPAVLRENYRMLGAIIITPNGNYFVKFYGPQATVAAHERTFQQMLESLQVAP